VFIKTSKEGITKYKEKVDTIIMLSIIASSSSSSSSRIGHYAANIATKRILLATPATTASSSSSSLLLLQQAHHGSGCCYCSSRRQQQQQQQQQQFRNYSSTRIASDRIVVAVGGNALQRRGERLTIENMLKAAADMAPTLAQLASEHELVLTHGNGPQVSFTLLFVSL
jgi:Amino acid kinase family